MTSFSSTARFRKHDSSELSRIDISSPVPKGASTPWKSSEHEERVWRGRTQERVVAAINDTSGRLGTTFLIGHSWCVGPAIFLSWRIMIFVYMVVTLLILAFRGAFITSEVSTGIYVTQVIASFSTVLSSTIVYFLIRESEAQEMQEHVTWPQERLKELESRTQYVKVVDRSTERTKNAVFSTVNLVALLFTQNCCGIVVFWNIVFWFKVQGATSETSSSYSSDLILHFYNLIPVLYEIVIGCAVFKTLYYLPGTIAVIYVLIRISVSSFKELHTPQELPGWDSSLKDEWHLVGRLFQMFLIFIICCCFLTLTQRARQNLIRYL